MDSSRAADASTDPSAAGASSATAGAGSNTPAGCEPNLGASFAICPDICPEQCNGRDDDCDDLVDEAPAAASCGAASAESVCTEGRCVIDRCLDGARDCDSNPGNGCEVAVDDPNNCGSCGRVCVVVRGRAACEDGECTVASCDAGFADCDEQPDACETATNTLSDCGGCGVACSEVANAAPSCKSGSCGVGRCAAGWDDCDDRADNGCETSLGTLENCMACGQRCDKASCAGGVCTVVDCGKTPGRADCDGDEVTCEVNLHEDTNNCGRCGFECAFDDGVTPHATLGCTEDGCRASCDAGYGDCDGNYRNGCEQPLNTTAHCGTCRRGCNIANASESCSTGTCQLSQCDPNYADCDGDKTSCEVAIDTTANCGMCGRGCSLAHASEQCSNRVCEVAQCDPNWGDCDGNDANGCEQDVRPLADGGAGPCAPGGDCVEVANGGRTYFICSTPRNWQEARNRCRLQRGGDLAQIESEAEASFLAPRLPGAAWVGLNEHAAPGVWAWANDGVPVWQGAANGSAIDGAHTRWAGGEPNGSGDCVQLYTGGSYDDTDCAGGRPFVCEIHPDACPNDPKTDPGQCGCSTADEDTDDDGFAQCNDDCPNDPNKRAPGDCGCGASEADRDGDRTADCVDNCDDDPMKREPGVCGCGVSDADGDGDGTPNCRDGCPTDATTTADCFAYDPANVDPGPLDFGAAPSATLNCGTTTLNTSDPPSLNGWCGAQPALTVQNGLVVVALKGLQIPADNTLRLVGSRPVALIVDGEVNIAGTIDASANGGSPGAGGNQQCGGSNGGDGTGDDSSGASGGGGGGFGTAGGVGGVGEGRGGGAGGAVRGNADLVPLLGGCSGGGGGGCGGNRAAGGGAVQLSASGAVRVSGVIRANGANGANGCGSEGGGAGGGSGGAVLVEGRTLNLDGGTISVIGGNGGESDGNRGNGSTGAGSNGGNGGDGGSNGGGGGGGGYGRLKTVMR